MKILAKPTSSPSSTEKPPPPQMLTFLRTNTIARSRGRSRSSPMFLRKKKNNSSSVDTQSEPSSPKVTCTGQVRSSKPHPGSKSGRRKKSPARLPCSCSWVNVDALFRTRFGKRLRPGWGKFQWFSPFGYCRNRQKSKFSGSPEMESNRNDEYDGDEEEEEEEYEGKLRVKLPIEGFGCCTPPRNALWLTRCRSAPYKPSSLASRFWGQQLQTGENRGGGEGFPLERESSCGELVVESGENGGIDGNLGEIERGLIIEGGIMEMETWEGGGVGRNRVLTRCKSVPARRIQSGSFNSFGSFCV